MHASLSPDLYVYYSYYYSSWEYMCNIGVNRVFHIKFYVLLSYWQKKSLYQCHRSIQRNILFKCGYAKGLFNVIWEAGEISIAWSKSQNISTKLRNTTEKPRSIVMKPLNATWYIALYGSRWLRNSLQALKQTRVKCMLLATWLFRYFSTEINKGI